MTVKDPVCGMEIDSNTAAGMSEYNGQTYYFCSPGCKKSFDKEPENTSAKPRSTADILISFSFTAERLNIVGRFSSPSVLNSTLHRIKLQKVLSVYVPIRYGGLQFVEQGS